MDGFERLSPDCLATQGSDPLRADTDGDGLNDAFEDRNANGCLDPGETSARQADTDGGGRSDAQEQLDDLTNPLLGNDDYGADPDGDGLLNEDELIAATDRLNSDSDGDGLTDGREVKEVGTDPLNPDSDGGGASDGLEVDEHRSDPFNPNDDFVGYLAGELTGGCHCAAVDLSGWLTFWVVLLLRRRRRCA